MSTYEELKEEAAPGPWAVPEDVGYPVAIVAPVSNALVACANGESQSIAVTHAKLITHCCNHFDALLEALREAKSALQHHGLYGDATTADAALAAAQEVK